MIVLCNSLSSSQPEGRVGLEKKRGMKTFIVKTETLEFCRED
jgi:hypothetical protein